jgi:hypothetical protein
MRWLIVLALLFPSSQHSDSLPIGIIDFYGLRSITEQQVREALQINEGDPSSVETREAKRRVETLAGVAEVSLSIVCCDSSKAIVFVGIREKGVPSFQFRPAPQRGIRLPPDIVRAGDEFLKALADAVLKGHTSNDASQGHSLSSDSAVRAVQERYIEFASRDLELLRDVLRHSSDEEHRALAAEVMAYTAHKQAIVTDLVEATRDPAGGVRNNATRALAVMAESNQPTTTRLIKIPAQPFIEMLNSVEWTDRNKAAFALLALTKQRRGATLSQLLHKALPSLVEMASWKSSGHAYAPFFLLGRVAGVREAEIHEAWERGDRKGFIESAAERARTIADKQAKVSAELEKVK